MIVDDHPVFRLGLFETLSAAPGLEVCCQVESGEEALTRLDEAAPDLLVVDLSLPGMDGLDLIKRVDDAGPVVPILVLSMHDESLFAELTRRAVAWVLDQG